MDERTVRIEMPVEEGEPERVINIPLDVVEAIEAAGDGPLLVFTVASSPDLNEGQRLWKYQRDYPNARLAESVVKLVEMSKDAVPVIRELVVAYLSEGKQEAQQPLPRARLQLVADGNGEGDPDAS